MREREGTSSRACASAALLSVSRCPRSSLRASRLSTSFSCIRSFSSSSSTDPLSVVACTCRPSASPPDIARGSSCVLFDFPLRAGGTQPSPQAKRPPSAPFPSCSPREEEKRKGKKRKNSSVLGRKHLFSTMPMCLRNVIAAYVSFRTAVD